MSSHPWGRACATAKGRRIRLAQSKDRVAVRNARISKRDTESSALRWQDRSKLRMLMSYRSLPWKSRYMVYAFQSVVLNPE
jgi:hypothetical protein